MGNFIDIWRLFTRHTGGTSNTNEQRLPINWGHRFLTAARVNDGQVSTSLVILSTQRTLTVGESITVLQLVSRLTGLDLTGQENILFLLTEIAESKQGKQETSG